MARVLVVDDDVSLGTALIGLLGQVGGYAANHVSDATHALEFVRAEPTDLALVDVRLGTTSGLDLLSQLKVLRPEMSVIMITALPSIDTVVEAMKLGADNFVVKPIDPPRLLALVAKGLESHQLRRKSEQLDRVSHPAAPTMLAESEEMADVMQLAHAVAPRPTTVLLLGETGTGKGMLARHIHAMSPRACKPFVELNCAGLTRELAESELFGYEKGAFTGAQGRKVGLFDAADGGTLFLDEIGELEAAVQAKLLKALEERRFRRVGGVTEIEVDVRVIAATHRDLEAAVAAGRFRSDLLYCLNVFPISLPPLRARRDDVLVLA
ncbi:MAG TPA: sigma-54 dependent transcriptional regulator, partial [Kofleriaceae bacterium]